MKKKLINWFLSGGGASSFTPSSLSPVAWWDNGSTYMASDGSAWTDRVGGFNLSSAGGARPTYNSSALGNKTSFSFDGVDDILAGSRITAIQGAAKVTYWMVCRRGAMSQDDGSNNAFCLYQFSDDAVYGQSKKGGTSTFGSVAQSNLFHYIVMVYDGTQSTNDTKLKIWINGVAQTLSFTGTIPTTTENNASSVPKIGSVFGAFWAGEVCEAGIVADAISTTNRTNLEGYLDTKYSITPSLLNPLSWWRNGAIWMASDGGSWTDYMGRYSLTAAGTAKPTFNASAVNGLPSFSFDGSNDQLTGSRITEIQGVAGCSWILVEKRGSVSHDDNSSNNQNTLFHFSDDTVGGRPASSANRAVSDATTNAYKYLVCVFDGSQGTNAARFKIWINSVAQTLTFTGTIPALTESNASSIMRMGNVGNNFWAGENVEVLLFNKALNATEVASINSYLSIKYAL